MLNFLLLDDGWWNHASLLAGSGHLSLEALSGWWVVLDGVALRGEHLEVLQGVGIGLAARLLEVVDQVSVAIEIFWKSVKLLILDVFQDDTGSILEEIIDLDSVRNLVLKSFLILLGWLIHHLLVKVVEVDVSHIDGKVILSLLFGGGVGVSVEEIVASIGETVPHVGGLGVVATLELTDELVLDAGLTPLEDVRLGSLLFDELELLGEGLDAHLGDVSVFHPVDGEKVTEAGTNGLAVDLVVWRAVGTPGTFMGVGSGQGVNIDVIFEDLLEHGAGLASLHVNDHLFVHLVFMHVRDSFMKLVGVKFTVSEPARWKTDKAWGSMIEVRKENLGVLVRLEDLTVIGISLR